MLPQGLDDLTFRVIEALVAAGLREGRTLDFKRDPVGARDEDKREFLADVSAFANTAGGDLLFGVEESGGEATAVPGLVLDDPDAEIRRPDGALRSGIEPRLPRVDLRWLPGHAGQGCLLVRVPRSFVAPHRVVFRDHAKFYGRSSAGKHPLDVAELRAAFLSSDGLMQGIRRFRQERLGLIEAGEGALPVRATAKLAFHIVPLAAFASASWRLVEVARGSSERTCPVAALETWLTLGRVAHGPMFRRMAEPNGGVAAGRLSDKHVARLVKRTALAAGVRGDLPEGERRLAFAGHSLRAGLATAADVEEALVQRQLGHASPEMTRGYKRRRERFRVNLTKASGL